MKENGINNRKQIEAAEEFERNMKNFCGVDKVCQKQTEGVIELTVVIDQTSSIQDLFIKTCQIGQIIRQKFPEVKFNFGTSRISKEVK